jgi:hypothetical protein
MATDDMIYPLATKARIKSAAASDSGGIGRNRKNLFRPKKSKKIPKKRRRLDLKDGIKLIFLTG